MKKVISLLAAFVIMLLPCFTANAYPSSGSITLVMINKADKQPVSYSRVVAVKVADCIFNEAEVDFSLISDYGTGIDLTSTDAAQELYPAAKNSKDSKLYADSDKNGKAVFEDCATGAYLIYSTEDIFSPFLAFVPMVSDDGINFYVTAEPKIDIPEEETTTTDGEIETTTEKTSSSVITEKPDKKLPKTGMLQLPVPILGLCGALMFSKGFVLYAKGKKEED